MSKVTARELRALIEAENWKAVENADVSGITNMSFMFYNSRFNGDISQWDVSNVTNIRYLFYKSKFNGDISQWDVSNITNMSGVFYDSQFNGDISQWNPISCKTFECLFNDQSRIDGLLNGPWKMAVQAGKLARA